MNEISGAESMISIILDTWIPHTQALAFIIQFRWIMFNMARNENNKKLVRCERVKTCVWILKMESGVSLFCVDWVIIMKD